MMTRGEVRDAFDADHCNTVSVLTDEEKSHCYTAAMDKMDVSHSVAQCYLHSMCVVS